jgi:hypothetical protein
MGTKMFVAKKGVGEGGRDILVVPGSYVTSSFPPSLLPSLPSLHLLSSALRSFSFADC